MKRLQEGTDSPPSRWPEAKTKAKVKRLITLSFIHECVFQKFDAQDTDRASSSHSGGVHVHGTEAFFLIWLIVLLLVVSILTTGASVFLMIKLRLFPGLETIVFKEDGSVVFNHGVEMDTLHLATNAISGVQVIEGNILIQAGGSRMSVNKEGIQVSARQGLRVLSSKTGEQIFPVDFGSLPLPASLSSLTLNSGAKNVKKIRSPVDEDLEVSGGSVKIGGSQGIRVEGRVVSIDGRDIQLTSQNGSIVLDAAAGIYMPALLGKADGSDKSNLQYKLCICSKTGLLFKLHMKTAETTCADVRFPESANPCA